MSGTSKRLTRVEIVYCITVATAGVAMIAALVSLKGSPQRLWIVQCLGAINLAMLPAGIAMEIVKQSKRIPFAVGMCLALTAYVWFVFLVSVIRGAP